MRTAHAPRSSRTAARARLRPAAILRRACAPHAAKWRRPSLFREPPLSRRSPIGHPSLKPRPLYGVMAAPLAQFRGLLPVLRGRWRRPLGAAALRAGTERSPRDAARAEGGPRGAPPPAGVPSLGVSPPHSIVGFGGGLGPFSPPLQALNFEGLCCPSPPPRKIYLNWGSSLPPL